MRDRMNWRTTAALVALLMCALPVLAQTGRVGGTVKDDKGQPIKGATVLAENPGSSPSSFTATTDDKGRFSIIGLRSGNWKFTASAPGFQPSGGQLAVKTIGQPNPPLEFTLAAGAPAGGAAGLPKEVQAELAKADEMVNAKNYDGAISAYQAILQKAPTLTLINLRIGQIYRVQKNYDGALAAYKKVLETDPNNDRAKIEIGMTNLEKGDLAAAEASLTEAAQSTSANREVFYNLGEVKFAKGETDESIKWYERAAQADATWAKPYLKLGFAKMQKGDAPGAVEMMEKVIALEPTGADAAVAKQVLDQLKKG